MDNSIVHHVVPKTKTGMMNTHDRETVHFFRGSPVLCERVRCFAQAGGRHTHRSTRMASWLRAKTVGGKMFTHHQKTVVLDAPSLSPGPSAMGERRRVIGFVGGIDLTTGRYDSPAHPLFSTLHTEHQGDFRQQLGGFDPNFGPRQPWHDCHAMVEGPVARDIVLNFEQRWIKQVAGPARPSWTAWDLAMLCGASWGRLPRSSVQGQGLCTGGGLGWGGGGSPPPPNRTSHPGAPLTQPTFGPTEGQNEQWREANRRHQRQTIRYRGLVPTPPPPPPPTWGWVIWMGFGSVPKAPEEFFLPFSPAG